APLLEELTSFGEIASDNDRKIDILGLIIADEGICGEPHRLWRACRREAAYGEPRVRRMTTDGAFTRQRHDCRKVELHFTRVCQRRQFQDARSDRKILETTLGARLTRDWRQVVGPARQRHARHAAPDLHGKA